jgi:uncharacterized membrane protein
MYNTHMKEYRTPLSLKFILGFVVAGFFFSGYLTAVKLFSGACAFNETCPTFLGFPACWYGFALYITLLTLTILAVRERLSYERGVTLIAGVSFVGILFAGYLTATELPAFMQRGFAAYTFGVPTCFLGLIFFMLIFVSAVLGWSHYCEHNK